MFVWDHAPEGSGMQRWVIATLLRDHEDNVCRLKSEVAVLPRDLLTRLLIKIFDKYVDEEDEDEDDGEGGNDDDDDDDD